MNVYEVILTLIGIVAYTIKAMQPKGFLYGLYKRIRLGCYPCLAGWLSLGLVACYTVVEIFIEHLPYINPLSFLFIGAFGFALSKFME